MGTTLWRDVVNSLGEAELTPSVFLPLLEDVAARHADSGHFLRWIPRHHNDPRERVELDANIHRAEIAFAAWHEQGLALRQWASANSRGPFSAGELEDWWFTGDPSSDLEPDTEEDLDALYALLRFDDRDALVRDELGPEDRDRYFFFRRLRKDLGWLRELDVLRTLARKTWPADPRARARWTGAEFAVISEYYGDQQPMLESDEETSDGIDPFGLFPVSYEQSLGFGLGGLAYCMTVLLRTAFIGFMDEILDTARFPQRRGSLQCVECGTFVGRGARGYGQRYCGARCKKRAAKRRYCSGRQAVEVENTHLFGATTSGIHRSRSYLTNGETARKALRVH